MGTTQIKITDVTDQTGRIARLIELNRPEKLNCLSLEILDDLLAALENTNAERIILTGAGRAFCTGLDLNEVAALNGGRQHLHRLAAVYRRLLEARSETVALAAGYAVGGGAGLLACAKTVIVADDFRFRLPGGNLAPLAAIVPPVCNLRTAGRSPTRTGWLGCDLDAGEARQIGLVDRVVSRAELAELMALAAAGKIEPEPPPRARTADAIAAALSELDRFLQGLDG